MVVTSDQRQATYSVDNAPLVITHCSITRRVKTHYNTARHECQANPARDRSPPLQSDACPHTGVTTTAQCDSILSMTQIPGHSHYWLRLAALGGLLAGFGVRLFRLGAESLWYDETVSAVLAGKPLAALIAHTAGDIHPPGYYLLLSAWGRVAQPTTAHGMEFLFAFFSLWCGLVVAALVYALGRRLISAPVGVLALWITAFHPFHLWYGQEVRMYTLAAALGLFCLWALHTALTSPRWGRWLAVYVVCAVIGLYSLYYFLFLLFTLNLIALGMADWGDRHARPAASARLSAWLGAQAAVLLLWLPWLPTFWRQVTEPPVPPWRAPWPTWLDFLHSVSEALAALLVGQSAPGGVTWPWALGALLVIFWALRSSPPRRSIRIVVVYTLAPLALIMLISLVWTPIYHVRYFYPFAALFPVITAAAIASLHRWRPWYAGIALAAILAASGWSLHTLWTDARHRRDDHRGAVAYLADAWRPGDVILVNAGWVYTALQIYWPTERTGPWVALPPAPQKPIRLTDSAYNGPDADRAAPRIIRTGSVNGDPQLGWGDPDSDFFPMTDADTIAALTTLATPGVRIWHYRLYDTVSDPDGLIRAWLNDHATLALDLPFAGRDYLRLQRYDRAPTANVASPTHAEAASEARFGDALQLLHMEHPSSARAGERIYVTAYWQTAPGATPLDLATLGASLRLAGASGAVIAQEDAEMAAVSNAPDARGVYRTSLALSIPAAAKPGPYNLRLVIYSRRDAIALPITPAGDEPGVFDVGVIDVSIVESPPLIATVVARFGYLDLVTAQPAQQHASAGETFALNLVWRPQPSAYQDTYLAHLRLRNQHGQVVHQWEEVLGGWAYPSGSWPSAIPVLDPLRLTLPTTLPDGEYAITLQVARANDGAIIPARRGWLWPQTEPIVISRLAVGEGE